MNRGRRRLAALATGILFGLGLGLSGMMDREKVLGFLDLAGAWNPTLLFVLGGAVGTTLISFRFVLKRKAPLFGGEMSNPAGKKVDARLVVGAAIFGVGWGISGYCPGPGIAALVLGSWLPVYFLLAFTAGTILASRLIKE